MIRIGICGYGNLGRGVESEISKAEDMELVAIFTKREPSSLKINSNAQVVNTKDINEWIDKIDVMIMCGGSATDLPEQVPEMAKLFNTIDSFDTHAKIPEYYQKVNESAKSNNKVSIISIGWDPGLFSLLRMYSNTILPVGETYTFWGKGVSQGHSDAIRRIEGVKNAVQYTIPKDEAVERVMSGENPELTVRDKHLRECFVVAEEGADKAVIEEKIKTMPNYFSDYDTIVHFVDEEELKRDHSKMPHGGFVIRSGTTHNGENNHIIEFSLKLQSNPEFTASVLLAYARANYRLQQDKNFGAKSIFEIPPYYLSAKGIDELNQSLL